MKKLEFKWAALHAGMWLCINVCFCEHHIYFGPLALLQVPLHRLCLRILLQSEESGILVKQNWKTHFNNQKMPIWVIFHLLQVGNNSLIIPKHQDLQ